MAKKQKAAKGQLPLIDVEPKNSKKIIACIKQYKAIQSERIAALNEEIKEKEKLLSLIEGEHLQRLEKGKIEFTVEGYKVTVTPREELIQVKQVEPHKKDGDE